MLTVTALQEIPSPPGTATVRIDVEIDTPEDDDEPEAESDSDPVDDALAGAGRAAGGLVEKKKKMIAGVVRAIAPDDGN